LDVHLDQEVLDLFLPLQSILQDSVSEKELEKVHQAFLFAAKHHDGQFRSSGEPYISHPTAVAIFLANWFMDVDSIIAALLHDLIEDTSVTKEDIVDQFGIVVANLVDGVSKLTKASFNNRQEAQAENFRKMLFALAKDIRVILVKLADRLHNMQTISILSVKRRRRIAKETLDIFAPIANRIGMYNVATDLEDLGFAALYPNRYKVLKGLVAKIHGQNINILDDIKAKITQKTKEVGVNIVSIDSRAKNIYSIYCKMKNNGVSFSQITDVYAIRLITESVDCCYRALGIVHSVYKPVPGKFKDYIALPKANGYQSLHTVLFGPYGVPIEVQLRTLQMDDSANNGVSAHWQYKSAGEANNNGLKRARSWVQRLLDIQNRTLDSLDFIENVKIDLFPDEIYIFSPKGNIFNLPTGSTALDFAYAVHTDIGNSCVAVKVNRQMSSLSTVLYSGQTVEVMTSKNSKPNNGWLNFVRTAKARSSIKHFIKQEQTGQAIFLGKKLLTRSLNDLGASWSNFEDKNLADIFGTNTLDDILEDIGMGRRSSKIVAHQLVKKVVNVDSPQSPLVIVGTEGLVLQFSHCCCPVPGDPIIGELVSNQGIEVHRACCNYIVQRSVKNDTNQIPVVWGKKIVGEYLVKMLVELKNEKGGLAMLALAISDADSCISDIKIIKSANDYVSMSLEILVTDRVHLANVLRKVRRSPRVLKVYRFGDIAKKSSL
jgi:guanosine-3',5'-bis(diphosphate) 3'-pyrophosphohydrolase